MRFLFVDRILQLSPGESIRGIKHVTQDDAYLCYDETGRLCFIPSLIGETLGQLAAWNVMSFNQFSLRPVAGVVASARVYRAAYVGETLELESFIERLDDTAVQYHSIARINREIVFRVDGALGPLLSMDEFIDEQEVRRQFQEIYRPGEWSPDAHSPQETIDIDLTPRIPKLSFDKILASEPGISLVAEKNITRAAPFFPDHFPRKPVLPMTVLLECKLNLAREFLVQAQFATTYQISELRKIKMNEFIYPGDIVTCYVKVKQQDDQQLILSYRSEVEGKRVCVLELVMTAKGC
ncbi:hydroxymyristoyl-ACP dehydratase [Legionella clemsonensis]|uniref:3-hydroxyacyl-[acyl-carrier-protein] dehydratase FabZ n=1 Tax=Legionella clemsonensis TaxID=1867846 RepID=A0A222P5Q5_9GAMM|nr:hydroxymyristoyl-ACP dehydratase [Legionella clemsonensis]ASQ47190.1 3-hydroxyacyl-[acyl-carrier-protein] dehydratase FabZ [Legionella clemsonensis]